MWGIIATVIGSILSLLNALILLSVRRLTERLDKQDAAITAMSAEMARCKVDCQRNFVPDATFLREIGYMRRTLDGQTAALNRMEGQLTIVEKLPQICGDISRAIVSEMKDLGK